MAEKPPRSKWDRWNWHPVVPALLLGWWLFRIQNAGWDWGWLGIVGTVVFSIWLLLAVSDKLTGGRVVDWMNSPDDDD